MPGPSAYAQDLVREECVSQSCACFERIGEIRIICSFYIEYYANPGSFRCVLRIEDNLSIASNLSDLTNINSLLAIGVDSPMNYSIVGPGTVSNEIKVNVTNYGNVKMNLSLRGYAANENDGFAMNCSVNNISIMYEIILHD